MSDLVLSLLLSLGVTELVECAFAFCLNKRGKALLLCALVNVVTNPPVVLLYHLLGRGALWVGLLELSAVAIEGGLYRYSGLYKRPFAFSLGANGLSFLLGLLMNALI